MKINSRRATPYKKELDITDKAKMLLNGAKYRSSEHNIDYDLDVNWVLNNLQPMKCQLTDIQLTLNYNSDSKVKPNSASIHRLIPEYGYTKRNCMIIANSVNMFLSNHNVTQILPIAHAIVNNTEKILLNYKLI